MPTHTCNHAQLSNEKFESILSYQESWCYFISDAKFCIQFSFKPWITHQVSFHLNTTDDHRRQKLE